MKKVIVLLVVLALTVNAFAGIAGSKHDFSTNSAWNTAGSDEICAPCHAPHGNEDTSADPTVPLWNHAQTAADYPTYTSDTMSANNQSGTNVAGVSKLCLSCHDGTVELDSYGGASGVTTIAAGAQVTNLTNSHPVGIEYTAAMALEITEELVDPATAALPLFGASSDTIECATCHDVHGGAAGTALLQISNTDSALCTACHIK